MSTVRVNLDAIDDWKVTLGQINSQCIEDISALKQIIDGDLDGFKGHSADVARELATGIMEIAQKAHENIDSVQKTLTNVEEVKSNA